MQVQRMAKLHLQARENTERTRAELDLARVQWIFYENALEDGANAAPVYRTNVATTSERITQVMEEVVSQLLPAKSPAVAAPRRRTSAETS
jgi:hypothetical protein